MARTRKVHDGALDWLLEDDECGVRYLALRDIERLHSNNPTLVNARKKAHQTGPISALLACMSEDGYWSKPGPGYNPKYYSTVWSVITLAQLGASVEQDKRVARACAYVMDHALTPTGQFTATGTPSGTSDCLQGNLCWALMELGYDDPRLKTAFEWMARTVTGEGIAPASDKAASPRYYAGKCGPLFMCGANGNLSCAWGAVKVLLALVVWPAKRRTPLMQRAIRQGAEFLLGTDPAGAGYPCGYSSKPSSNWWRFGFPLFYVTDLLQNVDALATAGYGDDPRLAHAIGIILKKQMNDGRWLLEYDYAGKTWVDFGSKKQPNKWVTLRALRTLSMCQSIN